MRTKNILFTTLFFAAAMFTSLFAGEGLDYMKSVLTRFEVLRGELVDDFSADNRRVVTGKARDLALEILDIDEIGRLALGKHYSKMSAQQKKDFSNLFHDLMASRVVEANIPSQKIVSKEIPIKIVDDKEQSDKIFKKDAVVVLTQVPHKRVTYNVDFKLFRKGGTLRLYDVVIDGSSTLLDFRNQFSAIIQKKGVNYLISRLKTRMQELEKEQEDRLSGQNED